MQKSNSEHLKLQISALTEQITFIEKYRQAFINH